MTQTRFTQDHEWVTLDGSIATVGITDHAVQALGDIVFVELPEPGREVAADEACAVVESVKAASDVLSPLAGRVTEANEAIAADPATINREPAAAAWLFRLALSDAAAFDALMDEAAYKAFLEASQ